MNFTKVLVALLLATFAGRAQSVFPVRDEGETRSRSYHVLHYKIEVSFDEANKKVFGKVTTTLVPFLPEMSTVEFDAESLRISRVTMNGKALTFDVEPKVLAIRLDRSVSFRDTLTVSIEYSCTPKKGLYFIQPDSAYPDKPWQIWTQGEDMDNHFWFPCYDFPNDKATSEVIATVRSSYTVLSNGKLVSVKEDKKKGTKTFQWSESKPHSSYLIMMAAGDYAILHDRAGKLPVEYYVYHKDSADAWQCLRETPAMIRFYDEKIGFPYAWEKYAQIQIADFMYGGMENTSATTMADQALVYDARQRVDGVPTGLIAHELAHQWWGDVVTCKDWRHIWLNESFASYFDPLFTEFSKGRDEFDYEMYNSQNAGIRTDTTLGRKPVVSVGSYGENVYPRGASILHMLRFFLGDTLFWRSMHYYIEKYKFTPVETNDLKTAIEEATGQNLYWFFDQWLYKAGHPVFDVSYRWSDSAKAVVLSVAQTQKADSLTGLFRTPVDVEVTTHSGVRTVRLLITSRDTVFTIPADEKPLLVIFDKGNWLLKELHFNKPMEEWRYQAASAANPVDRIQAIHTLAADSADPEVPRLLAHLATADPFWGVRQHAVEALRKLPAVEADARARKSAALIAAARDVKSSVRRAAFSALGVLKGDDVVTAIRAGLNDSSYSVVEAALRSLASADSAHALATIDRYLTMPSFLDGISNTALALLGRFDSVRALTLALQKARYGHPMFTRHTALNVLGKYGKGRRDVLEFCATLLKDKNVGVRFSAISTLGEIGDQSVIPALETIANNKDDPAEGAAKGSIERIQKREK